MVVGAAGFGALEERIGRHFSRDWGRMEGGFGGTGVVVMAFAVRAYFALVTLVDNGLGSKLL